MNIEKISINDTNEVEKAIEETRKKMLALKDETITLKDLNIVMVKIAKEIADMIYAFPSEEVNCYMLILSYMQSVFATFVATIENRRKNSNA